VKHIGFDRQIFTIQKYGGISRYFCDLYLGLSERQGINPELLFRHHQNEYLAEHGIGSKLNPLATKSYTHALKICSWRVPLSKYLDIYHSTYYLGIPKKISGKGKLVSTLYDMIPELLPKYFSVNPHANKLKWFEASDLIISISDSAANDLAYFQPSIADRIRRIHLYSGFSTESLQSRPKTLEIGNSPFVLFIGKRGGYKNSSLLLRAFAASEPGKHGYRLLFAGGGVFSPAEQADITRLKLTAYTRQLDVTDANLWYLYLRASAVLVPSIAEGFSLPLVEGLAADVPVICSDIPVHREVAGDFAQLVNPIHHQDWTDILGSIQMLKRPSVQLGADRYSKLCRYYSKKRMVNEHVEAYQAV
jgi:glycosyltransferase involved in cell wall biosynthesis